MQYYHHLFVINILRLAGLDSSYE